MVWLKKCGLLSNKNMKITCFKSQMSSGFTIRVKVLSLSDFEFLKTHLPVLFCCMETSFLGVQCGFHSSLTAGHLIYICSEWILVYLYPQLEAKYLFLSDLISITGQREMPLPSSPSFLSLYLLLVPQRSAMHSFHRYIFPDAALSSTFIFSHCCVFRCETSTGCWGPSERGAEPRKCLTTRCKLCVYREARVTLGTLRSGRLTCRRR